MFLILKVLLTDSYSVDQSHSCSSEPLTRHLANSSILISGRWEHLREINNFCIFIFRSLFQSHPLKTKTHFIKLFLTSLDFHMAFYSSTPFSLIPVSSTVKPLAEEAISFFKTWSTVSVKEWIDFCHSDCLAKLFSRLYFWIV